MKSASVVPFNLAHSVIEGRG